MVEFITLGKKYKTEKGQIVEVTSAALLNDQIDFLDFTDAPRLVLVECSVEGAGYLYALNTQLKELE